MPRVVQITDVHLHHDPHYFHPGDKPDRRMQTMRSEDGRTRAGNVNVRAGLELVLEDAARREGPLGPEDLLVVTGDLVQDFRRTTYVLLRDLLLQAAVAAGKPRIRCLAGNHDINEMVRSVFPAPNNSAPRTCFAERLGGWLVLGVDTESATSPHQGPGGGGLSAEVLRWLRQQLRSGHRTLLVMHHPPLATINSFMDGERGEGLFDADDRAALEGIVVEHREQIAGIFCVRRFLRRPCGHSSFRLVFRGTSTRSSAARLAACRCLPRPARWHRYSPAPRSTGSTRGGRATESWSCRQRVAARC